MDEVQAEEVNSLKDLEATPSQEDRMPHQHRDSDRGNGQAEHHLVQQHGLGMTRHCTTTVLQCTLKMDQRRGGQKHSPSS